MNRIAVYIIYDKDGILDGYRVFCLKELRKVAGRIVVVVNGILTPDSRNELELLADNFFVRENTGYDTYAFKAAFDYIGWDELYEYDELIMANDAVFGPVFPFEEMFTAMAASKADFWGATKNFENKEHKVNFGRPFKHGYFRGNIISNMYVIRKRLLNSPELRAYWEKKPEINNYGDAVFFNEFDFNDYLIDTGFSVDCYQSDKLKTVLDSITARAAYQLLADDHIPLVRRQALSTKPIVENLLVHYGKDPRLAMEYIDKHTGYDVNLIWDNIIRNTNLYDLWARQQLEYIVPKDHLIREYKYEKKIAVICHIYYADLVEECASYAENFPENTDFYLTASLEETEEKINRVFAEKKLNFVCTRIPNIGRDVPALWVTYAGIVTNGEYEYICFFHDKKVSQFKSSIIGEQYKLRCYENIFGTKEVVKNIINLFEENPRLGVLGVPWAYHGLYFDVVGRTWKNNYTNVIAFADKTGIKTPTDPDKPAASPYGTKFWFRAAALRDVIGKGWTYKDFDVGFAIDGTVLHAIERIYGLAAQSSGYYYASVINDDNARSDLVNYQYMLYGLMDIMRNHGIISYNYLDTQNKLKAVCEKAGTGAINPANKPAPVSHPTEAPKVLPEFDRARFQQEFLETVSWRLLFKKLVKRSFPKSLWRYLSKKRCDRIDKRKIKQ
jgi:rhamnosyltransferase